MDIGLRRGIRSSHFAPAECRGRLVFLVLVIIGFSLALARPGWAQTQSSTNPDLEKRVELLERKLDALEKRVDAALLATAPAPTAGSASDRIQALDDKVHLLEANQTAQADLARKAPVVSAERDGFSISSPDKAFSLKVGGYVQADGKTFYDNTTLNNFFIVRRARLNFDGKLGKYIDIRLSPELGNGTAQLYDAYADLKYRPYAALRGGKFKTPLGLEELQNDSELTFIERALPFDLVPNRDEGFQVFGDVAGFFTYQFATMNGALDGTNIDGDTNKGKDLIGRVFLTPFSNHGPSVLKGLGFGVASSTGRQNGTALSPVLPSFKTLGQNIFFSYATGAFAAGRRLRYTPQLYYYNGPFGLLAEYVESGQAIAATVNNQTVSRDITNHAWQVAGSWVLTGEKKSYRGVIPHKGLEGIKGNNGIGAWELAARITEINIDPTAFLVKFADPTKSAQAARAWTVGLNWYLSRNARISLNYDQTHFEKGATTGNRKTEKTFSQRLQVVF
jgi:phosphate-selective porin OprO/OprP